LDPLLGARCRTDPCLYYRGLPEWPAALPSTFIRATALPKIIEALDKHGSASLLILLGLDGSGAVHAVLPWVAVADDGVSSWGDVYAVYNGSLPLEAYSCIYIYTYIYICMYIYIYKNRATALPKIIEALEKHGSKTHLSLNHKQYPLDQTPNPKSQTPNPESCILNPLPYTLNLEPPLDPKSYTSNPQPQTFNP
jgi:hypothetical protein